MSTPRLQLALDCADLPAALAPLARCAADIDVIEVGTVLLFAEGLHAIRAIRAIAPEHTILADARIAEAGSVLAPPFFSAGADWVSCVAGASLTTIEQTVAAAHRHGGAVQVELGETYDPDRARAWRELGVEHVIVKRSRDREAAGELSWGAEDVDRIAELDALGFTVTVTGGIGPRDLPALAGAPVSVVIAGRSIVSAADPSSAAASLRAAMREVWS